MSNTRAPIILFVYNRLWHTQQTLNALMQNELAAESDLIVYSDGEKILPRGSRLARFVSILE